MAGVIDFNFSRGAKKLRKSKMAADKTYIYRPTTYHIFLEIFIIEHKWSAVTYIGFMASVNIVNFLDDRHLNFQKIAPRLHRPNH